MPKLLRNMHVLAVNDLDRSARYYSDVLHFEVSPLGEDAGWRLFKLDSCMFMAGHCPDALPAHDLGDHSYFAYIVFTDTESLNTYHEKAVAAGAELIKALSDEPWNMREFGVRTIDGHRIMFGCEI